MIYLFNFSIAIKEFVIVVSIEHNRVIIHHIFKQGWKQVYISINNKMFIYISKEFRA